MTDWRPFAPTDSAPAGPPAAPKNYAAEAAIKVTSWRFMQFLEARHGLEPPLTAERATQRLRSVLRILSRKELNDDEAAAERWRGLRAEFEAWLRATEPKSGGWRGATHARAVPRDGERT